VNDGKISEAVDRKLGKTLKAASTKKGRRLDVLLDGGSKT